MAFPDSLSAFYQLSGTEPFGIQKENDMASAYVFEDGSFTVQGSFEINGDACLYSLQRNLSGTLPPYMSRIKAPDAYEEWDYTTASGAYVCIDWCRDADWPYFPNIDNTGELKFGHTVYIHYTQDDAFITLWGYVPDGKEDAEAFADMFDFAKACSGRPISS